MPTSAEIVICGAGIAGISAAYHLAVTHNLKRVLLIDERDPMSLTSDKSTEAYRNWWPGPDNAMVAFMNRSIDLLEEHARETNNAIHLNRRGYLYATSDSGRIPAFIKAAELAAQQGAGLMRLNDYGDHADGADMFTDPALIRKHFSYLTEKTVAVIHARRCGWFSSTELGTYLLEKARAAGVELIRSQVTGVEQSGGRIDGVRLGNGDVISTGLFVNAAGPFLAEVARHLDLDLPIFSERHTKVAFRDHLNVVPRDAPLVIWTDPQTLEWSDDEREFLAEDPETRWMTETLPGGVHLRPEGGEGSNILLMLWAYDAHPVPVVVPPQFAPSFPDVVLRGLATMISGLRAYIGNAPKPMIDGGYYTKTKENRPLIGPLPVEGAFVVGALSGFGIMAAPAAGELLAAHIVGDSLPSYASSFLLSRYDDPAYQKLLAEWGDTGQL
ncbi:MAG TPA: FAD-dependent oxidoreductase [Anaerolineales bacterium]|nr:FAD-dependent oxidoreductase [Anaerolineales bacterium]